MRLIFEPVGIIGEAISVGMGAQMALIPDRQLHGQGGKKRRFDPAKTQAGAHAEIAMVGWQLETRRRGVIMSVKSIMPRAAQKEVQRDFVAGIDQVIQARGKFGAAAVE